MTKQKHIHSNSPYKYYFLLQLRRLNRTLKALGIHPYILYVFAIPVFILISKLIFDRTDLADWIYVAFGLLLGFKLCKKRRVEQLDLLFTKGDYYKIRAIEHFLLQFPFMVYLIYERKFYTACVLVLLSFLLTLYRQQIGFSKVLPTPFKKWPFEFIVGFRKTFILHLGVYLLLAKGIQVGNYKLALFCLPVCFLICCSYYLNPERVYFVWIFEMKTLQFLRHKISVGLLSVLAMSIPLAIVLLVAFPDLWYLILGLEVLGLIIILTIILAKYSAFPYEMNLPQVILFVLCLVFPFLFPVAIYIFYSQAKRKLLPILG